MSCLQGALLCLCVAIPKVLPKKLRNGTYNKPSDSIFRPHTYFIGRLVAFGIIRQNSGRGCSHQQQSHTQKGLGYDTTKTARSDYFNHRVPGRIAIPQKSIEPSNSPQ